MSGSDAAHLARVRDNQRRSRARRKEYLQEVEGRLRECEQTGVAASAEIQAAARRVAEENSRLRMLLIRHGVSPDEIAMFLNDESLAALDQDICAANEAKTDDGKVLEVLLKHGGVKRCGPGECGSNAGRSLSASYLHAQDTNGHQVPILGSTPDSWTDSPSVTHHGPPSDISQPQTSRTPDSATGSIRQLAPRRNGVPHLTPESSSEACFNQPRAHIHPSVAPLPSSAIPPHQNNTQILATMHGNQNQPQYHFQPQPQPTYTAPAQAFHSQPLQQRINTVVYQPPAFNHVEYAISQSTQQPTYDQNVGTNSCVYATDLITSMATNAHPVDVRTDLGCLPQCATDCEVDNRTVFDVMDRYSGMQQT